MMGRWVFGELYVMRSSMRGIVCDGKLSVWGAVCEEALCGGELHVW